MHHALFPLDVVHRVVRLHRGFTTCRGLCEITLKYDGFGSDESARTVILCAPSITDQALVMCDVEFIARPRQRVLPCRAASLLCRRTVTRRPGLHRSTPFRSPRAPSPINTSAHVANPRAINNDRRIIASRQGVSPLDEINLHVFSFRTSLFIDIINNMRVRHCGKLVNAIEDIIIPRFFVTALH